jgi:hypothetical protein
VEANQEILVGGESGPLLNLRHAVPVPRRFWPALRVEAQLRIAFAAYASGLEALFRAL